MGKVVGIIVAVILVVGVVVFALNMNDDNATVENTAEDAMNMTQQEASQQANNAADEAEEAADMVAEADQEIDIVMSDFMFSQDEIQAQPGDTITVNLSVDSGSHDFVIDELDVQSDTIGSGQTDSVTFTVPDNAAGETYAFYCSIGNHRSQGMEGQLVISE